MWRLVLVVSLLCCSSEASVSCRDENGAEVERCKDQPPKINGKEKSVPQPRGLSEVAAVDVQKRVLNGRDCTDAEGKHYVALVPRATLAPSGTPVIYRFADRFCGGNLISDEWILTAEHCDDPEYDVILGHHPPGIKPLVPNPLKEERMHIKRSNERHYFPDDTVAKEDRHDIMLVKLPQKTSHRPITLPLTSCKSPAPPFPDNPYTIMGWSFTDVNQKNIKNKTLAKNLQCGDVKLHPRHTGRNQNNQRTVLYKGQHLLYSYDKLPCDKCPTSFWKKMFSCCRPSQQCPSCSKDVQCATCPNKKRCEACPGDSGGSLVKNGVLVGVTVFGPIVPKGETFYMDVCAYIDWIRKTAGIKEKNAG